MPGTPLAHQAKGYGLKYAPDPPYETLETPEMSSAEVQTTVHFSRIVDRFFNQSVLQPAVIAAVEKDARFYINFLDFLKEETDPAPPMSLKRRADFLYRYLMGRDQEAAELVAFHWLLAGMPPDNAPGKPTRWKLGVPNDAVQVAGNGNTTREGRVWQLAGREGATWFVFDRAKDRFPVGVYQSNVKSRKSVVS